MSHDRNITGTPEEIEFQKGMLAFQNPTQGEGRPPILDEVGIADKSFDLNVQQFGEAFLDTPIPKFLNWMFDRRGPFQGGFDADMNARLGEYRAGGIEPPDPDYDPLSDVRFARLPEHMWSYAHEAKSYGEGTVILNMLQKQLDRKRLIQESGFTGTLGHFTGILAAEAPVFPLRGLKLALGFPLITSLGEGIQQYTDPTVSAEESAYHIGTSAAFGAGFAALHGLLSLGRLPPNKVNSFAKGMDDEIRSMETGEAVRPSPMVERAREDFAAGKNLPNELKKITEEFGLEAGNAYAHEFGRLFSVEEAAFKAAAEAKAAGGSGPGGAVSDRPLDAILATGAPTRVTEAIPVEALRDVNSRAGMKKAIREAARGDEMGRINAEQAKGMESMVDAMPDNFFARAVFGSAYATPSALKSSVRGMYFFFEDVVTVFGRSLGKGVQPGKTFAHETGHRVFFTMASEEELRMARGIFDDFQTKRSTVESLKNYPNKADHFSEWWAFEFADYWVRVLETGRPSALTFLEAAYAKQALGMSNAFESMMVKIVELSNRLLGRPGFEVTQEQLLDSFFSTLTKRIDKEKLVKILEDIENRQHARAVRFERGDDYLSGSRGAPGSADNVYEPNLSGASYSRVVDDKPFIRDYVPANDGDRLLPAWFLEKLPDSPIKRLLEGDSPFARHIASYLTEHPFYQRKNVEGVVTPHGVDAYLSANWLAPMVEALKATDDLYYTYRQRFFNEAEGREKIARPRKSGMFQFAEDKIRGAGGALSRAEFMEQVGRAKIRIERTGPADIELLPEAIQAAKVWQEKLYGPAGRAAQELRVFSIKQDRRRVALEEKMQKLLDDTNNPLGMTVKQLRFLESLQEQIAALKAEADVANTFKLDPNYMNRLYNKTKIEADRDQFINILVREGGYTPQEAAARTDSILTGKAFEVIEEDATGMARSLKERQIDVDSIFLEDYLELNIASVGRYYATRMGADIELARAFGSIDMKEVTQRIVAEYDAVIQNIKNTDPFVKELKEQIVPKAIVEETARKKRVRKPFNLDEDTPNHFKAWKASTATTVEKVIESFALLSKGKHNLVPDMANNLKIARWLAKNGLDDLKFVGEGKTSTVYGNKNFIVKFTPIEEVVKIDSQFILKPLAKQTFDGIQIIVMPKIKTFKSLDDLKSLTFEQKKQVDELNVHFSNLDHSVENVGILDNGRIVNFDPQSIKEIGELKFREFNIPKADTEILSIEGYAKVKKIEKKKAQSLEDVRAIRDRIRGTYGIPEDPSTWTHRSIRVAKMFNAVTLLTGALAATADLGKLVMTDGIKRTMGPVLEAYKSDLGFLAAAKLAKQEANLAGEALDMYLAMRSALFADLADSLSAATPFERKIGNVTQQFFNVALMNQWNEGVKTLASLIAGSRIILESENLLKGSISKTELTKLSNLGIGREQARIIVEQTKKHGLVGDEIRIAKTELWDLNAREAAQLYTLALGKDIRRIIVTPGKGEIPLFMSKPIWTMLWQFKSFAIAATHRTLTPGLQLRDQNFMQGLIALTGLGAAIHEIRRKQLGIDRDEDFGDWVTSIVERGGHAGVISDFNNMLEVLSDGRMGLRPLLGASRGPSTTMSKASVLGGPIVQQASNAARVIWDIGPGDADDRTINATRRLLYGSKMAHTSEFFDLIEDGAAALVD